MNLAMEFVPVRAPRARIERTPEGVEVTMPADRRAWIVAFLFVWLCGWAFGLVLTLEGLAEGKMDASVGIWVAFWVVVGGYWLLQLAWMLAGREVVAVDAESLTITRRIGRLARRRAFDRLEVSDLRVSPDMPRQPGRARFFGGPIAFDYGSKTYRLGAGVEEAEAKQIAAALLEARG